MSHTDDDTDDGQDEDSADERQGGDPESEAVTTDEPGAGEDTTDSDEVASGVNAGQDEAVQDEPVADQRQDGVDPAEEAKPQTRPEAPSETPSGAPVETFDAPSGIQLLEGEEVLHDMRPSWGNYSKSLWSALLTIWLLGFGLVFLVYPFLARRSERYIITTDRVIHRSGLMSTTTNEYRIADIRGIQTGQSLMEKVFGSGNIKFTAAGGTITFSGVPDAQQAANSIRRQKAERE